MISNFFYQVANLKKVKRSGWKSKLKLVGSESVADHTYMMSVMAMVLSDIKKMDTEKIIKMTILHDCLLYTSPRPRDKRQSRMPSSA